MGFFESLFVVGGILAIILLPLLAVFSVIMPSGPKRVLPPNPKNIFPPPSNSSRDDNELNGKKKKDSMPSDNKSSSFNASSAKPRFAKKAVKHSAEKKEQKLRELPVIEVAKIAREISSKADIAAILDFAELLTATNDLKKALHESNEALKYYYESAVFQKHGIIKATELSESNKAIVDAQVKTCMEMGLRELSLDERLKPYLESENIQDQRGKRIEKGKGWADLKDQL